MFSSQKLTWALVGFVLGMLVGLVVGLVGSILLIKPLVANNNLALINSYEQCAQAGYPIQESFPPRCVLPDGRSFTDKTTGSPDVDPEPTQSTESPDYYGSSTFSACRQDAECKADGCNTEVCGGKTEGIVSDCIAPAQDTPTQAGYTCGCKQNKCQWSK